MRWARHTEFELGELASTSCSAISGNIENILFVSESKTLPIGRQACLALCAIDS